MVTSFLARFHAERLIIVENRTYSAFEINTCALSTNKRAFNEYRLSLFMIVYVKHEQ